MEKVVQFDIGSKAPATAIIPGRIDSNRELESSSDMELLDAYVEDVPQVEGKVIITVGMREIAGMPIASMVKNPSRPNIMMPILIRAGTKMLVTLVLSREAPTLSQTQELKLKFK